MESDLLQIAELERLIFTDAWSLHGLRETFAQPRALLEVAEEEGSIQGYAIVYDVVGEAEIARIAVAESSRKAGVGSALLEKVCEWCIQRDAHKLLLDVRNGDQTAVSFYRHLGFTEDGIRKGFYEKPKEDALLMSKQLP
ncbi:MAG: ribosomal protein S18-alanine N-acetyltransferase [Lachnospiraceae bacterium]